MTIYDAIGRRKSKTVNGAVTNHYWDGSNIVMETDGNGNKTANYYEVQNCTELGINTKAYIIATTVTETQKS